jgi:NADH dehydrogenase
MRLVLTGVSGFLGQHLLTKLNSLGHECCVLVRSEKHRALQQKFPGTTFRVVDLSSPEDLENALQGADGVINLIGILNEKVWEAGGSGFRAAHVAPVAALIEACEKCHIRRFIQVSALNAGKGRSHYLQSKGEAERILRSAAHIDETIIQPAVIFGPGDSFFNRFAGLLRFVPVLPLACPDAKMQPVWVEDVVTAIGLCLDHRATVGHSLELVGPEVFSLRQLVQKTAEFKAWKRAIVGLPNWLSFIQAVFMNWVPGRPFSLDNYRSLQIDSVSHHNALVDLGIHPTSINDIVPSYLSTSR